METICKKSCYPNARYGEKAYCVFNDGETYKYQVLESGKFLVHNIYSNYEFSNNKDSFYYFYDHFYDETEMIKKIRKNKIKELNKKSEIEAYNKSLYNFNDYFNK